LLRRIIFSGRMSESGAAANFCADHGGTYFNSGHQGTQGTQSLTFPVQIIGRAPLSAKKWRKHFSKLILD
jgi:hypothetical protein